LKTPALPVLASLAVLAASSAGLAEEVTFTRPPVAARTADGRIRITFAVSQPTDAEAAILDGAGNRIARIGSYGNADSAGPDSKVPEPEIAFAWPTVCDYAEADGKLYVTDSVNRRVVVVRFDYSATAECPLP